ncbi:hypothetical protein MTO96_012313 [Rhipicephalus appendiculatus]
MDPEQDMLHENLASCHLTLLALLVCGGVVLRCLSIEPEDDASNRVEDQDAEDQVETVVRVFYGIPYAKPPTGQRRFDRAESIEEPWTDVFDATVKPNSCFQVLDTLYGNFSGSVMWNANTEMSEDCLKLNVWTPGPSSSSGGRPLAVLVWIYGGGFYSGTSTLDVYDARTLVSEENVVVVSMNYRVASLGFLSFGNETLPGNAGLYDQYLALKWVRENVAAFGGDPDPSDPVRRKRRRRQRGPARFVAALRDRDKARESAKRLATALRAPDGLDQDTLDSLRCERPEDIVNNETNSGGVDRLPVRSRCGRRPPARYTSDPYGTRYFFGLPVTEETPEVTKENFMAALEALDPSVEHTPIAAIMNMYTAGEIPSTAADILKALDSIVGDYHFTCPAVRWADTFARAGIPVYQYVFARRSSRNPWPRWTGVIHGEEVPFVFGEPLNDTLCYSEEDKVLSRRIMRYWANFAKTGNPNLPEDGSSESIIHWPEHTDSLKRHLVLDVNESVGCAHRQAYCEFWENVRRNRTSVPSTL